MSGASSRSACADTGPPLIQLALASLDRINQIVPAGVTLNPADAGYGRRAQTPRIWPAPGR